MRFGWVITLIGAIALLAGGCGGSAPTAAPTVRTEPRGGTQAQTNIVGPQGDPQPKLRTIRLWLGPKEIIAEQAVSFDEVQTGMMFRREMGEDEGMLFIFAHPFRARFWMRNTLIPLSCAYIDSAGTVLELHDMKPLDETGIDAASDQVQYVLEMKQGWFDRNKIGVGTIVRTERGSLADTYFRAQ